MIIRPLIVKPRSSYLILVTGGPGGGPSVGNITLTHKQSIVQRCVILQKDEKGYGLTVSGDNPVHVQSIKESE